MTKDSKSSSKKTPSRSKKQTSTPSNSPKEIVATKAKKTVPQSTVKRSLKDVNEEETPTITPSYTPLTLAEEHGVKDLSKGKEATPQGESKRKKNSEPTEKSDE